MKNKARHSADSKRYFMIIVANTINKRKEEKRKIKKLQRERERERERMTNKMDKQTGN